MKILTTISYYKPYISGLTICAQRLIGGLSKKGFGFTVLTSRYQKQLPTSETAGNIKILRLPVLFTLGKVPVMPGYLPALIKELRRADLVWIHLPQAEGLAAVLAAKMFGKKVVATVHCLPLLPSGWQRFFFQKLFDLLNNLIIKLADRVVYYTKDYAENTKELWHFAEKSSYILPPTSEVGGQKSEVRGRRDKRELVIGFAGRVAEDKGLEYLIKAIQLIKEREKNVRLMMAGTKDAVGERRYAKKINSLIDESGVEVEFLGVIYPEKMIDFYRQIDILVLPSVNRTEAFGIVQAEAMKYGVPVVAGDLPGVRMPIRMTGMGKLVKAGDARDLAKTILEVGKMKWSKKKISVEAEKFSEKESVDEYVKIFKKI